MTKKFLKEWGQHLDGNLEYRGEVQRGLDGGGKITRYGEVIEVDVQGTAHVFVLESPGRAVKFAAALNKLRRPIHLIKQDLDQDWAEQVKKRDNYICAGCNVMGDKIGETIPAHTELDEFTGEAVREVKERIKKDVLTAHHWLKTKSRAGMARWARACGVTYHYAEHIHTLHENPCWVDLEKIYRAVAIAEGEEAIKAALALVGVEPTEARVRALWLERCGNKKTEVKA
jgi:hypothetical protein